MGAGDFQDRLSNAMNEIHATNGALAEGVKALLVGRTVVDASAEVWDGDGNWSIMLSFDDGSVVEVPGQTWAAGPLAELVVMAGGDPHTSEVG